MSKYLKSIYINKIGWLRKKKATKIRISEPPIFGNSIFKIIIKVLKCVTLTACLTKNRFSFSMKTPEKMMHRHKCLGSLGEALDYLYGMTPAHVYISTAYYDYQDTRKMNKKIQKMRSLL
jgi:DNA primase catalytic subunit